MVTICVLLNHFQQSLMYIYNVTKYRIALTFQMHCYHKLYNIYIISNENISIACLLPIQT